MNYRAVIPPLLIVTIIMIVQEPYVYSQVACGVVNFRFQHPSTAHPGEMIRTVSIVTASCYFYSSVIVDLVDSRSNMILSRVVWPYAPHANPVSPPLINHAIARDQLGYWPLSIVAYFAGGSSGIQFSILVKT
jgi:hypothetical protein